MKKNIRVIFSLMIMAVVSLSLFSLSASAASATDMESNSSAQVQQIAKSSSKSKSVDINGKTIAIAVGASIVITGITVFLIWHSYKTNGQSEPYTYKKNAPLELTHSEDVHVDTIVNRRKIERNNN